MGEQDTATRERKLKFIDEFGKLTMLTLLEHAFIRRGPDWLTDEQIDDLVRYQIMDYRAAQRRNRQNRRRVA